MSIANPYLYGADARSASDTRLKKRVARAGVATAFILLGVKFFAFLSTNSVSVLSSLMDSAFDILASIVTLTGIIHAAAPADKDHRFGHGKIESLSALAQAVFVLGAGVFLFAESIRRFVTPQEIDKPLVGIAVMLFSIVMTAALLWFQRRVIRKTQSVAIKADQLHYKGDILMNFSVLAALGLGAVVDWPYFDPLFSLAISFRLFFGAWQIGRESFDILLDREIPDQDRDRIISVVTLHPEVTGVHDLRTRHTGDRTLISLHVEMNPEMSITRVHSVMDEIEKTVFDAFPKSEILIHPEPAGLKDHRIDDILSKRNEK
jgi:ferrous-iron efflux pump FieF